MTKQFSKKSGNKGCTFDYPVPAIKMPMLYQNCAADTQLNTGKPKIEQNRQGTRYLKAITQ